jgi:hypothetical protein
MTRLFYDTWAYLALTDERDPYHELAQQLGRRAEELKYGKVTSTYILDESLTIVRSRAGYERAVEFGEGLWAMVQEGLLELVAVHEGHVKEAWELFKRYRDIKKLSFTDCTSFVIMRERGIKYVFTGDAHFEQVNLGFQLFKG